MDYHLFPISSLNHTGLQEIHFIDTQDYRFETFATPFGINST